MAIANRTQQEKLDLANLLARAEAQVRRDAYIKDVNYSTDTDASLAALKTALDATIADSTPVP